jgi:hypothetical protein
VSSQQPRHNGRWGTPADSEPRKISCLRCANKPAMTKAQAQAAVRQSMGLLDMYECPTGLGWHITVAKEGIEGGTGDREGA